jgi:plastocyanin domain-containing protein
MKSPNWFVIITVVLVIGAGFLFIRNNSSSTPTTNIANANNVTIVDGQQIITINAKGGYSPSSTVAQAGLPTTLRMTTSSTFDCSSSLRIPSLGLKKSLPANGTTDISLGTPTTSTINGSCSMGMYNFNIAFK